MDLEWITKYVPVSILKDWEKNPRKISKEDYDFLIKNIKTDGFHDVLKVDFDHTIISGHQRKRALTELGIKEVWVMYPNRNLTETEKQRIAVTSNFHYGSFDNEILGNEFDLEPLKEIGFDPIEFDFDKEEKEKDSSPKEKEVECPKCGEIFLI